MDELGEDIRKLCCTCLSVNRKLYQLCAIVDGINNLYALLSHDLEAYKVGFFKDSTKLYVCWECKAIMSKICKFRIQACIAQKRLSNIEDGRCDVKNTKGLSSLCITNKNTYDKEYDCVKEPQNYIFIDCGVVIANIKTESDDDIPLSELNKTHSETTEKVEHHSEGEEFSQNYENHSGAEEVKVEESIDIEDNEIITSAMKRKSNFKEEIARKKRKRTEIKRKRKTDAFSEENKKHYTIELMSKEEMLENREKKRLKPDYLDAPNKCESCIEGYKSQYNFEKHMECHEVKPKYTKCKICLVYVRNVEIEEHRRLHYEKYICKYCLFSSCEVTEVLRHLRNGHSILDVVVPKRWKKGERKTPLPKNPGSRPRLNKPMMDKRTALGYRCSECDQYFDDKKQRWSHVQKVHREGFRCATCGKRFSFKNHLQKHERLHQGPAERTACPQCGKLVQTVLLATHARLHMPRTPYTCEACDKRFVSRESYNVHLKYSLAHAKEYVLKFKCDLCEKGYRSKGELADHINYQHMGKTQHKCPMCNKPLASRRCIARHIRRTHYGVQENPRDKVCQQCGKTFRDKKGLREHERIHTGERPLSCEVCGCTFRQSASLYTHKKRVHKIFPKKKTVQVVEGDIHIAGIPKLIQATTVLDHP